MARQITPTRRAQSIRDVNLKLLKPANVSKIKKQRKALAQKIQKQRKRLEARLRPKGDKKLQGKLTSKQLRRKEKQVKRNIAKQRKLKYQKQGGDIAMGKVVEKIDNKDWYRNFYSSNVWKFKVKGNNLLVAFLNGSIYMYFGVGRLFLGMLRAGSKGKFVWRNLRRKEVNFIKVS